MERVSIRNKYKNRKNNNKDSGNNNDKKFNDNYSNISNSNNLSKRIDSKDINKKNDVYFESNKSNIVNGKKETKKLSKETSSLMSSYKEEIEKELSKNISGYKNIKEDKKYQQMLKLLQIIQLCNTMNIIKNDKNAVEIIPHLYIGSIACASNLEELQSKKITHILCCGFGLKLFFPDKFKYHKIDLIDQETQNIRKYFDETNNFINNAIIKGGNVLVHCHAGISRSTSIILAYLMKHKQMKFNKAFELIKEKRGKIQPNSGFILQLKAYEKELGY